MKVLYVIVRWFPGNGEETPSRTIAHVCKPNDDSVGLWGEMVTEFLRNSVKGMSALFTFTTENGLILTSAITSSEVEHTSLYVGKMRDAAIQQVNRWIQDEIESEDVSLIRNDDNAREV